MPAELPNKGSDHSSKPPSTINKSDASAYWRANIKLMAILLAIWFIVSFGAGILFVDVLNKISVGGYPLGFWFAQQGSIYVFVGLIFFYCFRMNALDHKYGVDEDGEDIS